MKSAFAHPPSMALALLGPVLPTGKFARDPIHPKMARLFSRGDQTHGFRALNTPLTPMATHAGRAILQLQDIPDDLCRVVRTAAQRAQPLW